MIAVDDGALRLFAPDNERVFKLNWRDLRILKRSKISVDDLAIYDSVEIKYEIIDQLRMSNFPMQLFLLYNFARNCEQANQALTASQYLCLLHVIHDNASGISDATLMTLDREIRRQEHKEKFSQLVSFSDIEGLYQTFFPKAYMHMLAYERSDEALRAP